MAVSQSVVEATLETMRERAGRLEREAAALRSDLDEIAIVLTWGASRTVSSAALQRIPVIESEIDQYRRRLHGQYSDRILRLVLQAQKAATRLKRSVPKEERETAIKATVQALTSAAANLYLTIPPELEAVIGD